ncbi:MAG TPA: metallophosphoesterase [Rubrivivax sp.]
MTLLMHLSDTHFGTERPEVIEALVRLAQSQRPSAIIASGDITQRARSSQFAAAKRFIDRLGAPALVIPGNHDLPLFNLPMRLLAPYAGFQRAFGPSLDPRQMLERAWIAGVNTTRRWRRKHGEISAAQADTAARWLEGAPEGVLRVVVTHQPVAVSRLRDSVDLLRGGRQAAVRWARAGVHLVLGGHIHLPYFLPLARAWPELERPVWLAQAGTAVSRRTRAEAGNSVNLVRHVVRLGWQLERWDHTPATGSFERRSVVAFDAR